MKIFVFRWLPVLLLMSLIFALSANPNPYKALPTPLQSQDVDRLFGMPGHIFEYAILGVLTTRAVLWQRTPTRWRLVLAALICIVYALSDETHQRFVPGRSFELIDLILDITGTIVGLLTYWFTHRQG